MRCLRASLCQICPGVTSLPPLEMANHITVGRQAPQRQLVPRTTAGPDKPAPTYTVHQEQQVAQVSPTKKEIPSERATSLYRLTSIQRPEELPDIWQTLTPLTKEKARPAFEIVCRESARALRCKPPRITHAKGSPPTRTPLSHRRSQLCERHGQHIPVSGPFPISRV